MDELERQVDQVLSPDRAMRWLVRIIVLIVIVGASAIVLRVAWHMLSKVDQAVDEVEAEQTTHQWFVLKKDAIEAAGLTTEAAREALARHQAEVAERSGTFTMSHASDRTESARLNQAILDSQNARVALIREYNERAASVQGIVLGDLPAHIEVAE